MHFIVSSGLTEFESLLKFKGSLSNASALADWSDKTKPCKGDVTNWHGVLCSKGVVWGLQLERMGLTGKIDVEPLENLSELRTLSFKNNNFNGTMPEIKKLRALRSTYLSNNHFSGEIPGNAFEGMMKLKRVHLANNNFNGAIPSSLATLPKLFDLRFEGNKFKGKIPNFAQNFSSFNVSNNALEGPIPASLSKMNVTSFSGNKGLCGLPLTKCDNVGTSTNASNSGSNLHIESNSKKPSVASIVIVAVVVVVALAAIFAAAFILLRRRKRTSASVEAPRGPNRRKKKRLKNQDPSENGKRPETSKLLTFVRDDRERFDLPDLLKASAEILGSGCFGASYKASLSGTVMVVKRFKQMNNVGKEDFHEHMRRLGRLSHPNLLPLVAYYYRKEEKLLITDHVEKGNLDAHLHGYRALGQPSMDWPTRLKIVKGTAKGLAYLCKELPSIIAAHGHLKSTNILLNQSNEPLLTDYGLVPVINQENAHEFMVAYRSPEFLQLGRITKKTDVWSLGILILELVTGKVPANLLPQGKESEEEDLASWVSNIPQEQWVNQVFDREIRVTKNNEVEIIKLLKIGLSCCEGDVEKRMDLKEAVEKINELKDREGEEDFYSSCPSEGDGDVKSSRGKSDDFTVS
ncbi:hypothetical protein JCGZ_19780 [Jatropha curcas]|uniref:Protein kinase domain-containing protein n=2 Tax=Jatropha curcas TaxID=180498 RepID=A0A067JUY2_JATCU|nr:hypothetical protein JCGZ_19780 [Jatropha curcas]